MTPDLVRFIQNTQHALRGFTTRHFYELAVSLRAELKYRGVDAVSEADALIAALLAHEYKMRPRIFSADCSRPGD